MLKLTLKLSLLLLLASLASCASSPPDIAVCTEITLDRGTCIKTVSNTKFDVDDVHLFMDSKGNGHSWFEMRPLMIQVPYESWAELKKWIIQECAVTGACDSKISSWDRTLNNIDATVTGK